MWKISPNDHGDHAATFVLPPTYLELPRSLRTNAQNNYSPSLCLGSTYPRSTCRPGNCHRKSAAMDQQWLPLVPRLAQVGAGLLFWQERQRLLDKVKCSPRQWGKGGTKGREQVFLGGERCLGKVTWAWEGVETAAKTTANSSPSSILLPVSESPTWAKWICTSYGAGQIQEGLSCPEETPGCHLGLAGYRSGCFGAHVPWHQQPRQDWAVHYSSVAAMVSSNCCRVCVHNISEKLAILLHFCGRYF